MTTKKYWNLPVWQVCNSRSRKLATGRSEDGWLHLQVWSAEVYKKLRLQGLFQGNQWLAPSHKLTCVRPWHGSTSHARHDQVYSWKQRNKRSVKRIITQGRFFCQSNICLKIKSRLWDRNISITYNWFLSI